MLKNTSAAVGNATALSAFSAALAADAASVQYGIGDYLAFASNVSEAISSAAVPKEVQISAFGQALANVLRNCTSTGHTDKCSSGTTSSFASVTQAAILVDTAVAADLSSSFTDIFTEASQAAVTSTL